MRSSDLRSSDTSHAVQLLRRDVLHIGGLTMLGLGTASVASLRRASADVVRKKHARNCILVWLDGGPSHLETFDLKPDAPSEVRGPLAPIQTSLAGVQLSECLPQLAQRLRKLAIIRSMTSPLGEHNFGTHYLMTGYKPTPVLRYPSFGSVGAHLQHLREDGKSLRVLPPQVAIPSARVGGGKYSLNGYLPERSAPFSVGGDPAKPDFQVAGLELFAGLNSTRLERRREFINQLDDFLAEARRTPGNSVNPTYEQAFELLTSSSAKSAFELDQESPAVRNKYGRKSIGQSCLLARRLVERGVSFVTVNNRGWDTHQDLYTRLKEGFTGARKPVGLIPSLDLAVSALVDDLAERSLLDETLIVVMGEFGRTPKLNTNGGRDHWPRVFSVLVAGGGVVGGQVIGESDAVGEGPQSDPVTPSDLVATIYKLLGIDPKLELTTADGRPVSLTPHGSRVVQAITG
ncbi:MAG: DUF1501 domain-containing protein [Planctomycetota bacterium]|nr:DUF1501 domain-containing protein [Planctomycetota bacterium]